MHPTPVLAVDSTDTGTGTTSQLDPHASVNPSSSVVQPAAASESTDGEPQYLLVLSGLIGSGKSTFARALVEHFPTWRRCNQDELGDRHAVVYAARTALLAGHSVVIDRTNIDAKQRRTWLELARDVFGSSSSTTTGTTTTPASDGSEDLALPAAAAPAPAPAAPAQKGRRQREVVTISLTLTISIEAAEERLRVRVDHETIKSAEQALGILPHFLRTYQKASTEEGFHYVLTYPASKMSKQPSQPEVQEILFDRLGTEPRAEGVLPERPPPRSGGGGRGGRGSGRGRGEWRGRGRGVSAVYTPHHQHQHQPYPPQHKQYASQDQPGAQASSTPPSSFAAAAAAASLPPPPPQLDSPVVIETQHPL